VSKIYQLEFLPAALKDMTSIVQYISHELFNPDAADKLAVLFVEMAEKTLDYPYANPIYYPIKPLAYEYRKLIADNYMMLYRIDEENKKVIFSRVVYMRRDLGGITI